MHVEPGLDQMPGNRTVIVRGWLEGDSAGSAQALQICTKLAEVRPRVGNFERLSSSIWMLDEYVVLTLGDINGYQKCRCRGIDWLGHGLFLDWICLRKTNLVSGTGHDYFASTTAPN